MICSIKKNTFFYDNILNRRMVSKRILVTGGSGMVGKYLQEYVAQEPAVFEDDCWIFISSKQCDLTDYADVQRCFAKYHPTHVIHLAANVGGLFKNMAQPVEMFNDNMKMNQNVIEACHKYGVQRAVFCLSTCVFPAIPSAFPMTEDMLFESPPHDSNASYAYAKRMLKLQCDNYNKQYGRQYICLSPVNLYGKWDNFHLGDSHVIPAMIHKMYLAFQKKQDVLLSGCFERDCESRCVLFGTGKPLRQFLHAGDFATIIYRTLMDETKNNDMMICSSNDEISISEVAQRVYEAMRGHFDTDIEVFYDTTKSDGIYKKTASNSRLLTTFPDIQFRDFNTGIKEVVDWFVANYENVRK
jgi:GDP-L-fucose synthase